MPDIAATCTKCGNIFPSGIKLENCKNVALLSNRSMCSACGHMAPIKDGIYSTVGHMIELVPWNSLEDIKYVSEAAKKEHPDFIQALKAGGLQFKALAEWADKHWKVTAGAYAVLSELYEAAINLGAKTYQNLRLFLGENIERLITELLSGL